MKFENTEVWGFKHALRGMRNPMNSWDRSDSEFDVTSYWDDWEDDDNSDSSQMRLEYEHHDVVIGENDMALAQRLVKAGPEHRKFMRQIFVSVDITAPFYWWKEFDTYKVGTTANSCSTMHKLASTPITLDCFELGYGELNSETIADPEWLVQFSTYITVLEKIRREYLRTKNKSLWYQLIRGLPESWLQKRTVTMTYENLLAMCSKGQRRFHKLNEWSGTFDPDEPNFIAWARSLPYAQELIFFDELEEQNNGTES